MDNNYVRVAVMGDYDSVLPFQAIGVETVVVSSPSREEIMPHMQRLIREQVAILFMTEELFIPCSDFIEEISELEPINIIPIPGKGGATGYGLTMVRRSVERAVGMDIFSVK